MWVDSCGVGFCDECVDDHDIHIFRATSIHCFCPIWLLGMFITDKGIDDRLSSNKRLTDLFYCDERFRMYPERVLTGPLKISELCEEDK